MVVRLLLKHLFRKVEIQDFYLKNCKSDLARLYRTKIKKRREGTHPSEKRKEQIISSRHLDISYMFENYNCA